MRRRGRPIPRLLRNVALLATIGAAFALVTVIRPGDGPPSVAALAGHAVVTDGDTIVLNGQRVRLEGLDAPEAAQRCERSGVPWPCGADATLALRLFVEGRVVRCADRGRDQFGRILGQCWVGEEDIGAWLVREGWAVAYTRYSWRYVPQEIAARWDGRGLWGGRFETPEAWRRRNPR